MVVQRGKLKGLALDEAIISSVAITERPHHND